MDRAIYPLRDNNNKLSYQLTFLSLNHHPHNLLPSIVTIYFTSEISIQALKEKNKLHTISPSNPQLSPRKNLIIMPSQEIIVDAILFDMDGTLIDSTPVADLTYKQFVETHKIENTGHLHVCYPHSTPLHLMLFSSRVRFAE